MGALPMRKDLGSKFWLLSNGEAPRVAFVRANLPVSAALVVECRSMYATLLRSDMRHTQDSYS